MSHKYPLTSTSVNWLQRRKYHGNNTGQCCPMSQCFQDSFLHLSLGTFFCAWSGTSADIRERRSHLGQGYQSCEKRTSHVRDVFNAHVSRGQCQRQWESTGVTQCIFSSRTTANQAFHSAGIVPFPLGTRRLGLLCWKSSHFYHSVKLKPTTRPRLTLLSGYVKLER
ncbi:hypothetical protein BDV37DRAFT_249353 [Aspergillus pseudonomiae]|uniref:Uncharacterized protein n=1 Tax=Aspergillus pseudonomiae TaxID=1506151 RepID=A0A5N7DBN8_9EURO|nr:uncharacterized protein BDV37DRAFT_249353 [Aspergillus pseudonomiae]KAE8403802.1 hypothetical protein BDV37DRAFT_249353 [Aspergillus pseudonomiae]